MGPRGPEGQKGPLGGIEEGPGILGKVSGGFEEASGTPGFDCISEFSRYP